MQLVHIFPIKNLLCLAAVALTACAQLPPPSQGKLSPQALEMVSRSHLPDQTSELQRQQWLDRITWGATDHDAGQHPDAQIAFENRHYRPAAAQQATRPSASLTAPQISGAPEQQSSTRNASNSPIPSKSAE